MTISNSTREKHTNQNGKEVKPTIERKYEYETVVDHLSILIPSENFSVVNEGVYRSAHPSPQNFSFLKKLKLKSIM